VGGHFTPSYDAPLMNINDCEQHKQGKCLMLPKENRIGFGIWDPVSLFE